MAHVDSERLFGAIWPLVDASSLILEEVKVRSAGRRQLIQIIVDADESLDLDVVAAVSREIDRYIEEHHLVGDLAYTLEVTSPGIERPLTEPRHWRKNIGRLVEVETQDGEQFTARIKDYSEGFITFEGRSLLSIDAVKRATVQIEFNRGDAE